MSVLKKFYPQMILMIIALLCIGAGLSSPSDAYLRARVFKLEGMGGYCSGEQVRAPSGKDYILTAAHCLRLAHDGFMLVTNSKGEEFIVSVIKEDTASDLLLLSGVPGLVGLPIAKASYLYEEVRTLAHGGGHALHKTYGEMLETTLSTTPTNQLTTDEEKARCQSMPKYMIVTFRNPEGDIQVCFLQTSAVVTTARVIPGASGGPALDSDGNLIGVISVTDGPFGYLVPLNDIKRFLSEY